MWRAFYKTLPCLFPFSPGPVTSSPLSLSLFIYLVLWIPYLNFCDSREQQPPARPSQGMPHLPSACEFFTGIKKYQYLTFLLIPPRKPVPTVQSQGQDRTLHLFQDPWWVISAPRSGSRDKLHLCCKLSPVALSFRQKPADATTAERNTLLLSSKEAEIGHSILHFLSWEIM